jgi:K+-transporting ATPase ATPase C chain
VGSSLLGQQFTGAEYFHTRPSAAGAAASGAFTEEGEPADADDLALVASGASNLGPTNEELLAVVADRVDDYRELNGLGRDTPVPVDAVTSSASGLDPHISIANAELQAERVATERGLEVAQVLALVEEHTTGRSLGFLGEPGVNVLELNLALDEIAVP